MKIYEFEKLAGLDNKVSSESSASIICPTSDADIKVDIPAEAKKLLSTHEKDYQSRCIHKATFGVNAILVSTNWNKNDDIFSSSETWTARYTPMFMPANMNHQGREAKGENRTVGVITSAMPVDERYTYIWPECDEEGNEIIPEAFHILVGISVWDRYFPTDAEYIKEHVEDGTMFVSMETFFEDFGYGLRTSNGDNAPISLLPRNEATAWLTEHLRVYGGTGKVDINGNEYFVGRWLRKITFSGVGFVEQPANPHSITFEDIISPSEASQKFIDAGDDLIKSASKKINENDDKSVLQSNQRTRLSGLWQL